MLLQNEIKYTVYTGWTSAQDEKFIKALLHDVAHMQQFWPLLCLIIGLVQFLPSFAILPVDVFLK